ncbi:MAG: hypothetical protein HY561_13835 [Gemmatimonadetes bacterium]|nr:hypothetical protein [Gemmatimonadota bacterium]
MRTLLKVTIPVETGNRTIQDGTLSGVMDQMMNRIKPEAAYALTEDGKRTVLIFFDMKDPSEIPPIAEPFFMKLNAAVQFSPVMNPQELQAGLGKAAKDF